MQNQINLPILETSPETKHQNAPSQASPSGEASLEIQRKSNDMDEIEKVKRYLHDQFTIKDLGETKYFLRLEIVREKLGIYANQRKYALDIIKDAGLLGAKSAKTPMPKGVKLAENGGQKLEKPEKYKSSSIDMAEAAGSGGNPFQLDDSCSCTLQ
ncbi:Reverse transcriptase, RNA-dependent DNA polymerase [Dillenia turbinata]|uniref:Reverse transcriptase, RNA-dependent DNA polymerase n=1 Tax=Dillenia turbinata TaxID=194707 RepID=A0AAN8V487_9MAGN